MTTTEYTLMNYFEEAHGALVSAAKHPQADNISKLIDALEEIDLEIFPNLAFEKEEPSSEYVSAPAAIEYGTTDPTEPKENSKISCPVNPIIVK